MTWHHPVQRRSGSTRMKAARSTSPSAIYRRRSRVPGASGIIGLEYGEMPAQQQQPFGICPPQIEGRPDTYRGKTGSTVVKINGGVHTNSGVQNHWFYLLRRRRRRNSITATAIAFRALEDIIPLSPSAICATTSAAAPATSMPVWAACKARKTSTVYVLRR